MPGRLRSRTSTSGRVALVRLTAAGPSSAVASTVIPASARSRATASRHSGWSSATTTLVVGAGRHVATRLPVRASVGCGPCSAAHLHARPAIAVRRPWAPASAPSRRHPRGPTYSAVPPRSVNRPRMLDEAPSRPAAAASSRRPAGIPTPLSRTVRATVSPSSSTSTHAWAPRRRRAAARCRAPRRRRPRARRPRAAARAPGRPAPTRCTCPPAIPPELLAQVDVAGHRGFGRRPATCR